MHLPWLGHTPLAGTEAHRVIPAREMLASGYWMVPVMFGQPFITKPPLHHWLIAGFEWLSGRPGLYIWRFPSAMEGALFCAAACWFAARWFGARAGLISGLCAVGLVALWGQNQTADIDATNALATELAAFTAMDLLFHQSTPSARWIIAAGLALAATLMAKGTAGLPTLVGVWGAFAAERFWRWRSRPRATWVSSAAARIEQPARTLHVLQSPGDTSQAVWVSAAASTDHPASEARATAPRSRRFSRLFVPILIALILFAVWIAFALHSLKLRGLPLDFSGLREAGSKARAGSIGVLVQSLAVMLPQAVLFALPMSASMFFFVDRRLRQLIPAPGRAIAAGLWLSTLIGGLTCLAAGMTNPRYANVIYCLLCPLSGAVVMAALTDRHWADVLRMVVRLSAIGLAVGAVVLTIAAWKAPERYVALSAAIACVPAAWSTIARTQRNWNAAWGLVILLGLLSIPFGVQRRLSRTRDSGLATAVRLGQLIHAANQKHPGRDAIVAVDETVRWRPEIFYYAPGIRVEFMPRQFDPQHVKPGRWLVIDPDESRAWFNNPSVDLQTKTPLCENGGPGKTYYLAWYAFTSRPDSSEPSTIP